MQTWILKTCVSKGLIMCIFSLFLEPKIGEEGN